MRSAPDLPKLQDGKRMQVDGDLAQAAVQVIIRTDQVDPHSAYLSCGPQNRLVLIIIVVVVL